MPVYEGGAGVPTPQDELLVLIYLLATGETPAQGGEFTAAEPEPEAAPRARRKAAAGA
jgi:hypothetical protein